MSFTPTFKYIGTIISWDLREGKDVEARIESANKLFGSAKATFWSNSRVVENAILQGHRRQHTSLGLRELGNTVEGGSSFTSLSVSLSPYYPQDQRGAQNLQGQNLKMCQVQDIIQTMRHTNPAKITENSW